MLEFLFRKMFYDVPVETTFHKTLKILYHPRLDYCRLQFENLSFQLEDDLMQQLQISESTIPAFLKFKSKGHLNGCYQSPFPYQELKHNQEYVDVCVSIPKTELLVKQSSCGFYSYYKVERLILCRYNKFLKVGFPKKVIVTKTSEDFYRDKRNAKVLKSKFSTPALNELNKELRHVYLKRANDEVEIRKYRKKLATYTNQEIVNAYNNQKAIYGVHQQVLYLKALDESFRNRFNKSPILNEEGVIYGLSGKIIYFKHLRTFGKANEN